MAAELEETRDQSTVKLDLLTDHVNELVAAVERLVQERPGQTQTTVIHKTEGMSTWGVAAVTACFFTFLGLILLAVVILPDLHDLQAWQDIMRQKLAKLEAK